MSLITTELQVATYLTLPIARLVDAFYDTYSITLSVHGRHIYGNGCIVSGSGYCKACRPAGLRKFIWEHRAAGAAH